MTQSLLFGLPDPPEHTFTTITLDPPWNERGGGKICRGAQRHYPLVKTNAEMIEVAKGSGYPALMRDDAHCWLWVTNNFLKDGIELLEAIGFRYVTNMVWVKPSFGIGQYFRGQHELCLFGVKGKGWDACKGGRDDRARDIPSVLHAPKREHSQKPEEFFDLVEARSEGPYVELFSRSPRDGWTAWGNEA